MSKALSASVQLEVPFYDVDSYRIVWHGNYAKYFELARCALLNQLDYDYQQMEATGYVYPVIELSSRFIKPIRYQQQIQVRATLSSWENDLGVRYLISDVANGEKLSKGHTRQVAVQLPDHVMQYQSPPVLLDKVAAAIAQG